MVLCLLIRFQTKLVSRIRELREEQKIQQSDFAERAGVSRQTIYYLERGESVPKLDLSYKIAKIFNKSIEEVFYYEPILNGFIRNKTGGELEEIAKILGMKLGNLMNLMDFTDVDLSEKFSKTDLIKMAEAFDVKFEELFIEEGE